MRSCIALLSALALLSGCAFLRGSGPGPLPERSGIVQVKGVPLTLLGPELKIGRPAPDFRVVDGKFTPVSLSGFEGKPVLISAVPSLDTAVCSLQTKRFNDEIRRLPAGTVALTISMDLPFAQKRFCELEKVDRVLVLSDSAWRDFGSKYGILIKERGLLARSIFVINRDGTLAYQQIVPEMSHQPNYTSALEAIRKAAEAPAPN